MAFNIIVFLVWCAGSYGVYHITQLGYSPWWIVVYALATMALAAWLIRRASKKNAA